MTPMIDVVFLLLVFFLCTASFQRPEEELAAHLLVAVSAGAGAEQPSETPAELDDVSIVGEVAQGATHWRVNAGPPTEDYGELSRLLVDVAAISPTLPVTIQAGPAVVLGELVAVYDAARGAGFASVRLAASADALLPASHEVPRP